MLNKKMVKDIQSLGQKKHRDEEKVFIAEGPKLIKELIASVNADIIHIYATPEWINENKKYEGRNDITEITENELERISQMVTPNKVLAIVKQFPALNKIDVKNKITLALETIQDPGNLGTIIRTADWFGVEQIVCSNDCADIYNPKVVQATMGSIARVKILYTDLGEWLSSQKDIRIYATVLEGRNITTIEKLNEGIIVIGNESKGISEEILKLTNVKLTIPKKGKAESLNAAVAVGVVLGWVG
jgi:TrmH family RNA methyltransferase